MLQTRTRQYGKFTLIFAIIAGAFAALLYGAYNATGTRRSNSATNSPKTISNGTSLPDTVFSTIWLDRNERHRYFTVTRRYGRTSGDGRRQMSHWKTDDTTARDEETSIFVHLVVQHVLNSSSLATDRLTAKHALRSVKVGTQGETKRGVL